MTQTQTKTPAVVPPMIPHRNEPIDRWSDYALFKEARDLRDAIRACVKKPGGPIDEHVLMPLGWQYTGQKITHARWVKAKCLPGTFFQLGRRWLGVLRYEDTALLVLVAAARLDNVWKILQARYPDDGELAQLWLQHEPKCSRCLIRSIARDPAAALAYIETLAVDEIEKGSESDPEFFRLLAKHAAKQAAA